MKLVTWTRNGIRYTVDLSRPEVQVGDEAKVPPARFVGQPRGPSKTKDQARFGGRREAIHR